ncbi:hypothetical protein Lser_V15G01846 [Lactuca serriola]
MGNPFSLEFLDVHELMSLLDFINPLVKQFRMARDRFGSNPTERIRLKLIRTRERDGRQYNLPTTSEVVALIVGDIDGSDSRDIVLKLKVVNFNALMSCIRNMFHFNITYCSLMLKMDFNWIYYIVVLKNQNLKDE